MSNNTFGMDLGTSNIKIYNKNEDSFFIEKNMIAIENKKNLLAYGDSAFDMYEKAPANIQTSYPVCNGVIADIKNMETLVKYFIMDQSKGTIKPADFYVAVPTDVTEVEKRAFYDLVIHSSAKAKSRRAASRFKSSKQNGIGPVDRPQRTHRKHAFSQVLVMGKEPVEILIPQENVRS